MSDATTGCEACAFEENGCAACLHDATCDRCYQNEQNARSKPQVVGYVRCPNTGLPHTCAKSPTDKDREAVERAMEGLRIHMGDWPQSKTEALRTILTDLRGSRSELEGRLTPASEYELRAALDELSRNKAELETRLEEALDILADCWSQFAYVDSSGAKRSGGLSTLEDVSEILRKNGRLP